MPMVYLWAVGADNGREDSEQLRLGPGCLATQRLPRDSALFLGLRLGTARQLAV